MMANVYFTMIKNHRKTIDDVPAKLKSKVQALLDAAGLDGNGDEIASGEE